MRTHSQIIEDAGGPTSVAKVTSAEPGTVKQWKRLDSIPGRYWIDLAAAGLSTMDELGLAAKTRASTQDRAA